MKMKSKFMSGVIYIYIFYRSITIISAHRGRFEIEVSKNRSMKPFSLLDVDTLTEPNKFPDAFIESLSVIVISEIGDKTFFLGAILAMKHPRLIVYLGATSALFLMTVLSVLFGWLARAIPREIILYAATTLFAIFGVKMLWDGCHMKPGAERQEMEEVNAALSKRNREVATTSHGQAVEVEKAQVPNEEAREVKSSVSQPDPPKTEQDQQEVHKTNTDPEESRLRSRKNSLKVATLIFLKTFALTFLAEWGDRSQITIIILAARADMYGVMLGGTTGHAFCSGLAVLCGRVVAEHISVRTIMVIGGVVFLAFAFSAIFFEHLLIPLSRIF